MTNNNIFEQSDLFSMYGMEEETNTTTTTVSLDDLTDKKEEETEVSTEPTTANETTTVGGFQKVISNTASTDDKVDEKTEEEKKKLSSFDEPVKDDKTTPASKTKTPPKKTSVGDEFKLKADTVVKYAGQEVPVTRYFTAEQIEKGLERKKKGEVTREPINEKDLVKKLNDDFAELVPQLTSLVFYEKQNIVIPVLQARTKGANLQEGSSTEDSFSVFSPKPIPFQLLQDFIAISKSFSDQHSTEIHADIYYDYDLDDFFLDLPKQVVHAVWADRTETAAETAFKFIERNYRKVAEIHSHHTMSTTPSSTDDRAERSPIFYAIVGRINNFFPEISVRTFNPSTQTHIPLKIEQVFEYPFNNTSLAYDLEGVEVSK